MAMSTDAESTIASLLRETESAHGEYEMNNLGERDQDWPIWYATYLFDNGLGELAPALGRADIGTLASFLSQLDEEYQRERPGIPWPEFYARRLVAERR